MTEPSWQYTADLYAKIGGKVDMSIDSLGFLPMFKRALENGRHVTKTSLQGTLKNEESHYLAKIKELGGRLIIKQHYHGLTSSMFIWDDMLFEMDFGDTGKSITINCASLNAERALELTEFFKKDLVSASKQGVIFAIMRQGGGLSMQAIGFAGTPLEEHNYLDSCIEDYKYIVKDLCSKQPSGRIAIFDGPPGTGKTYMVRSILMEVPDAMFVLVPPSMVSSLGGPELLPMLLNHKQSYGKHGPTIFVLEDADVCLAPRASDNMNEIASILSIGDGIFGSLFDIRIIATTNAKQEEIDEAILRAGRLSRRISIDRLNYENANKIYQRLLPGQDLTKTAVEEERGMRPTKRVADYSLAEIYRSARDHGWIPADGKEPEAESNLVEAEDDEDYDDE